MGRRRDSHPARRRLPMPEWMVHFFELAAFATACCAPTFAVSRALSWMDGGEK